MNIAELSATEIAKAVKEKKFSATDAAKASLSAIEKSKDLNAFVSVLEESVLKQASQVDAKVQKGEELGPLAGVPVAIKDNMLYKGTKTTCCSKILENYVSPYTGHAVEKLLAADALIVGKTNMDEFAMGSSTEHSAFGPTKNPWAKDFIPGGSSGGSAACVAAGSVPISLGSDTGGSIRQPASHCGVLGLKPTYGRVSRYGLVAFASSLDQIGPFARTADDMALAMSVISGRDTRDSTSVDEPVPDYSAEIDKDIKGLRVGLPKEYFSKGLDKEVEKAIRTAAEDLSKLGADVREISMPNSGNGLSVYYIIAPSEASSNLSRFDGMRYGHHAEHAENLIDQYGRNREEGFGPEVKRRILIGTYALSAGFYDAYYSKAQKVRTLVKRDFELAFTDVDIILGPTSPTAAFRLGEKTSDPLQMYLSDIFTIPVNLAGVPGITVPCGTTSDGLPIGVQFIGNYFQDHLLLRVAKKYLAQHPPLTGAFSGQN